MATVIPVTGETIQVTPPESLRGADTLIDKSVPDYTRAVWISPLGEAFVFAGWLVPYGDLRNARAARFIAARGGSAEPYGSALFLSREEWDKITDLEEALVATQGLTRSQPAASPTPSWTQIPGNTYPVKEQLKALGGKWDGDAHVWIVPSDRAQEALHIVASQPKQASKGFKSRKPRVSGPAQEPNGAPRLNGLAGRCHLCNTPIGAKLGTLFFAATAVRPGGKTGWLVECLPANQQGCRIRRGLEPIGTSEHISDEDIFVIPPKSNVALVADEGIEDLFEEPGDTRKDPVESLVEVLDQLDEDIPF